MEQITEDADDVLSPQIPPGESLKESYKGDGQVVTVTDRRVMLADREATTKGQETRVESVLLTENVVGTTYERTQESESPATQIIVGGAMILLGVILALVGINGDSGTGLLLVGAFVGLAGGFLIHVAEGSEDGSVTVTVHRTGDLSDKAWSFPKDQTDVAQSIAQQVADLHGPR